MSEHHTKAHSAAGTTFTFVDSRPAFEGAVTGGRPQHCTRGHTWDFGFKLVGIAIEDPLVLSTIGREEFCAFCLRDLLRANCGRVKEGAK